MSQERLPDLALLSIEKERARMVDVFLNKMLEKAIMHYARAIFQEQQ